MYKVILMIGMMTMSILLFSRLYAQMEDDVSCRPPSKKVQQLIEKAKTSSDAKTAVDYFTAALKREPENATTYFEYALYAFNKSADYFLKNPTMGEKSLTKAQELFLSCLEHCPDFHADVFYHLGLINYTQQNMEEAQRWFEKFLQFRSNDPQRYPEDYEKKRKDTKEFLQEQQEQTKKKAHAVPYNPKLVVNVSSPLDEYFPMLSPDNELMFYTRRVNERVKGELTSVWSEKFTVSQRKKMNLPFDNGVFLNQPFNDGRFDNYGASTLSVDNKEMILCACKTETVHGVPYKNCDLYSTVYERIGTEGIDFKWSELTNLGPAINTQDGWEGQPSLSADGNTLYFATTRKGSQDNDIYYSTRNENGQWQQARPVKELNTAGKDKSPFLHQDGQTIYFVSDGRDDTVGGLDIYYARKENGKWGTPKNIGYPINSEEDEIGIFISTDGKTAYFSSRMQGDWNIYSFELYEEARPKAVVVLKGDLMDENGQAIEDAVIEIAYENSDEITTMKVNGNDGAYAAIINTDQPQDVMVTIKKDGYAFSSRLIEKEELSALSQSDDVALRGKNIEIKEMKVGEPYTINDILYATNSFTLNRASKFILKGFARFLNEHPTMHLAIHGHTDDIGDDQANLKLSDDRAKGVKDYLISLGIQAHRLKAVGFGENMPKVPNNSPENRAQNRRTEFVIEQM